MGKFKSMPKKGGGSGGGSQALGQKKKIAKSNSFGQYASNKTQKKDRKLVNKDLIVSTLLAERKGNSFKDGRLSEKRKQMKESNFGGSLSAILQKGAYKKKFDLGSDDEDQDAPLRLTHNGKALEELDDFQDKIDYSSEGENIPAEIVDKLNFTGFDKNAVPDGDNNNNNNENRKKTKKEVYEEIIKKSKQMKYERQVQKEEDKTTLDKVNSDYQDISKLLSFRTVYKGDDRAEVDEFDRLTRQLQNDGRTQASTVIKKVEDKKQKKLQDKRRKQLKGIMSSDDEQDKELNNDDELETKTKKELSILKHIRKVENLNKFIDQIKTVKKNSKKSNQLNPDDEVDEEYDSLDEIDLDEDDNGEEENDEEEGDAEDDDSDEEEEEEMEHLELEDEFESEEEENPAPKNNLQKTKTNNKEKATKQKKQVQSSKDDDDKGEGENSEDEDDEEELESDEYVNESD